MTSDNFCATMTCMMWHEEHLLNVSVLETVHLSNLVSIKAKTLKKYVTKICGMLAILI
jgi:hypothetical protein